MKLGMMLEVDETFTTIRLSRSSEVRSRSGDDPSPLSGLFFLFCSEVRNFHAMLSTAAAGSSFLSIEFRPCCHIRVHCSVTS